MISRAAVLTVLASHHLVNAALGRVAIVSTLLLRGGSPGLSQRNASLAAMSNSSITARLTVITCILRTIFCVYRPGHWPGMGSTAANDRALLRSPMAASGRLC